MTVVSAPKGHTVQLISVLNKEPENFGVSHSQLFLHLRRQATGIRVEFFTLSNIARDIGAPRTTGFRQHRDIKLRDHELYAKLAVVFEHGFDFLRTRIIESPVSLQT